MTLPSTGRGPYDLVVIGGGNMGPALLRGMLDGGAVAPGDVALVEPGDARRDELAEMFPVVDIVAEVPPCRAAVLAVKPHLTPTVAASAAAAGATRVLSVAAGVTTAALADAVGAGVAVLRTMPNTPALVGAGVCGLSAGPGASTHDLDWAEQMLSGVGLVVRLPETQLDAVTGLTGSGPAYVFLIAEALIEGGVLVGLPRDAAQAMVAQLLVGSAELLAQQGDPARLRTQVTSPGGTTAAGLRELERGGVRSAVIGAVEAATARSQALGAER